MNIKRPPFPKSHVLYCAANTIRAGPELTTNIIKRFKGAQETPNALYGGCIDAEMSKSIV